MEDFLTVERLHTWSWDWNAKKRSEQKSEPNSVSNIKRKSFRKFFNINEML